MKKNYAAVTVNIFTYSAVDLKFNFRLVSNHYKIVYVHSKK